MTKFTERFLKLKQFFYIIFSEKEDVAICPLCNGECFCFFSKKKYRAVSYKLKKCCNCNLVIQAPRLTEKSLENYYKNTYRGKTSEPHKESLFDRGRRRGEYIDKFLLENNKNLIIGKKTVIYEVGCGYGGILGFFKEKYGCSVYGSDVDTSIGKFSKNQELDIRKGSINVFNKKSADIVILSHVLEHIADPVKFIKKVTDLIKSDGVIYIEVPGIDSPKVIGSNLGIQPGHLIYYDRSTLSKVCQEANLKVVRSNDVVQALAIKC